MSQFLASEPVHDEYQNSGFVSFSSNPARGLERQFNCLGLPSLLGLGLVSFLSKELVLITVLAKSSFVAFSAQQCRFS
jgi:hypothetical protein